jgi:exonuclease VII large subunit
MVDMRTCSSCRCRPEYRPSGTEKNRGHGSRGGEPSQERQHIAKQPATSAQAFAPVVDALAAFQVPRQLARDTPLRCSAASPTRVSSSAGFALIRDRLGHVVTSVKALRPGTAIGVRLADGKVEATVDGGRIALHSAREVPASGRYCSAS